jgi:hypothetical protein
VVSAGLAVGVGAVAVAAVVLCVVFFDVDLDSVLVALFDVVLVAVALEELLALLVVVPGISVATATPSTAVPSAARTITDAVMTRRRRATCARLIGFVRSCL